MKNNFTIIVIVLFIILSAVFYWLKTTAPEYNYTALMVGNGLMAGLSLVTWQMVKKQIDQRPAAFVRGVYGATLLKLMVCLSCFLLYVLLNRQTVHKPSLFVLMGIYVVYTATETVFLSKLARRAK